ncbi:MAG: adenylosuccinate lyase [Deltaproteobacteria bacterium]|nr:adenylosuccinate lyase [Deltaproteobacteria bacterium]
MNIYDFVNPMDFRYYGADPGFFERLRPYVSEAAFFEYQRRVETALILAFRELAWCSSKHAGEILSAFNSVTATEVYEEEKRTGHIVRALVNCVTRKVSAEAGNYVHLFLTSNDTTDTATSLRFQELLCDVVLPDLLDLLATLIRLAEQHANTPQIGRTHGQHAVPITFGFAIALYVDRLGGRIQMLEASRQNLRGKIAGAVGAYNALSLQIPQATVLFEKLVLSYLGMQPAPGSIASQIVQPEFITDMGYAIQSCFSVLANLADDIRHLCRSEIAELQEEQSADTVGSSTMPHKVNPKNFENIKSLWKAYMPRMTTLFMDQISEHQRDLTNSASQRFLPELLTAFDYCAVRLNRAMSGLRVNSQAMSRNLNANKEQIIAEPLYILLALQDCPNAYEQVRKLAREAREQGKSIMELARQDPTLRRYISKMRPEQQQILDDPAKYTGQSSQRTLAVCEHWQREAEKLRAYLAQEKAVLSNAESARFARLYDQLRNIENGEALPQAFCPAEDRRRVIEEWMELRQD